MGWGLKGVWARGREGSGDPPSPAARLGSFVSSCELRWPDLSPEVGPLGRGGGAPPPPAGSRRPTRGLEFLFPPSTSPPHPSLPPPGLRAGRSGEAQRRGAGGAQGGAATRGRSGPLGEARAGRPRPGLAHLGRERAAIRPGGGGGGRGGRRGASRRRGLGARRGQRPPRRGTTTGCGPGIEAAGRRSSCREGGGEF